MKIIHNFRTQDSSAEACLFRDNEESMNKGDDFTELFEDKIAVSRPGGGGYSHTLPIRVCAAQRGRDFEAPDLERGIHFRGVF